jgi:alkylated DNA repair dioxygenase AlkB
MVRSSHRATGGMRTALAGAPPTLALPLKGGGKSRARPPSPLEGEGWGGGCGRNALTVDDVSYIADALPRDLADAALAQLIADTPWRQDHALIFGRRVALPRLTAWYGDAGASYSYSGITMAPTAWTPLLGDLKARAETLAGCGFNSALLNYYRDGRDSVGWHADAEPELGRNPVIASLSLGATRQFEFRRKPPGPPESHAIALEHGSCLVMAGAVQHLWHHRLPRALRVTEPRINITFRRIVA